MRVFKFVLLAGMIAILAIGCSRDRVSAPEDGTPLSQGEDLRIDPESVAGEILSATGWELADGVEPPTQDKTLTSWLVGFEREIVMDDIAHYSFEIVIGDGPYEQIRLHRVVRERRPCRPIRTKKNLFALHGNPGNFPMMFLFGFVAPNVPDDQALAVYLAAQDVDVWGIDRSVNFVPAETTDLAFMADWGLQYNVDALRTGMAIARISRLFTGGGAAPLNLLGYSTGLVVGYATANHEAGLPLFQRQMGGFIAVDNRYKPAPGPWQDRSCAAAVLAEENFAAGVYAQPYGALFNNLSLLARGAPDGASPIVPGFTNQGAALFAGALTWMLYSPPGIPPVHFFGGVFDENGLPVDLAYTEYEHFLDFMMLAQPYNAVALDYDSGLLGCDEVDVPFDDNLDQITLPVMYVGAAGGIAPTDDNTLSYLGSDDITVLTAQMLPPEAALMDIGHVDLFTSVVAIDAVWRPIYEWIDAHSGNHGRSGRSMTH